MIRPTQIGPQLVPSALLSRPMPVMTKRGAPSCLPGKRGRLRKVDYVQHEAGAFDGCQHGLEIIGERRLSFKPGRIML